MSSSSSEPSVLEWDLSKLGDEDYFAYLVKFSGSENIVRLGKTSPYKLPGRIYFTGNLTKLRVLDYPHNDVGWPLMSSGMRSILVKEGEFEHLEIPVVMLDDTVPESALFPTDGEYNPKYALERFTAVQLLKHLDAFDWDLSEYRRSEHTPTLVTRISKLVLKTVTGGFPPLFRLSACPMLLFVSGEARRALEREHISGVSFRAISDYKL